MPVDRSESVPSIAQTAIPPNVSISATIPVPSTIVLVIFIPSTVSIREIACSGT